MADDAAAAARAKRLADICHVLDVKYKRCVSSVGMVNASEVTDRCGGFYSDLIEVCSNHLPVRPAPQSAKGTICKSRQCPHALPAMLRD